MFIGMDLSRFIHAYEWSFMVTHGYGCLIFLIIMILDHLVLTSEYSWLLLVIANHWWPCLIRTKTRRAMTSNQTCTTMNELHLWLNFKNESASTIVAKKMFTTTTSNYQGILVLNSNGCLVLDCGWLQCMIIVDDDHNHQYWRIMNEIWIHVLSLIYHQYIKPQ